jgi:hypothetical protein
MASRVQRIERQERLLRDREAIRVLRQHFTGYDARDGYSLDLRKIAQMPEHRRLALRKKYTQVATLLATPHVLVPARSKAQAKILRREVGVEQARLQRRKHFIVHVPDAKRSTVKVLKTRVSIRTKLPGRAEFDEQLFRWSRRPKSPDEMIAMLEAMKLPTTGSFYIQTSRYGEIQSEAMDKPALIRMLRDYLGAYDKEKYGAHRFLNQVIGVRWVRSKLHGKVIKQERGEARRAMREANRQRRLQLEAEARRAAKKA